VPCRIARSPSGASRRRPDYRLRLPGAPRSGPCSRSTALTPVVSLDPAVRANDDGSVDLFFGPTPPDGRESHWVQTVPGTSWFTILRLYGPLEPWFDKTWRPGEIEPVT
jgi:hypothetical protein